jgi:hypothetical protein
MRKFFACLMLLLGLLVAPLTANAAVNADLLLTDLLVTYSSNNLNVGGSGYGWTLQDPQNPALDRYVDGEFSLQLTVNGSDEIIVPGLNTFTLEGDVFEIGEEEVTQVPGLGGESPLLTGTVTQFWHEDNHIYFMLNVTAGGLKSEFVDQVKLSLHFVPGTTWGSGFSQTITSGNIMAESAAVPEPASLAIWSAMGIGALVIRRRYRTG